MTTALQQQPRKFKTPKGGRPRNQHGWVTPVKGGRWKLHWYVYTKLGDTGREERRHRSITIQSKCTKTQAEAELAKIVARECGAPGQQNLLGDSCATFGWFWTNKYIPLKEGHWSRTSRRQAASLFARHIEPRWGIETLADIDASSLAGWLNEYAETFSRSTVKHLRKFMRACLQEAVEEDLLRKNPMGRVQLPDTAREPLRPLVTIPQLRAVRAELKQGSSPRDVVMFDVLAMTGMRPSEMLALKWSNFDGVQLFIEAAFVNGEIRRTKTKKSKAWVAIPAPLAAEITAYRGSAIVELGWMFPNEAGKPMLGGNWLKRVLKPAATAAGVKMDLRTLRRSWATWAHELGASLKAVQDQLRHASSVTTGDVYVQVVSSSTKRAVDAVGRKYFQ